MLYHSDTATNKPKLTEKVDAKDNPKRNTKNPSRVKLANKTETNAADKSTHYASDWTKDHRRQQCVLPRKGDSHIRS
ncbi:hypothetical protein KDW_07220 [Dictyobacter vulcani]|uniref:Uncharacterized protein n=1 Tax=Dictyobacter vulcani TaxID=2607529 RepID=A0A5J4KJM8_9CHLR|nr:hypothetical protein KDW_07220 [Dictyobacter vulcani]